MIVAVTIIGILLLCFLFLAFTGSSSTVLYADRGPGSKVLKDKVLNIYSKPDRIEGTMKESELLEYKSRNRRVYESDIVQAQAGVISARAEGFNVKKAYVITGNGSKQSVPLGSTERILKRIEIPLKNARLVKSGGEPKASPAKYKCTTCSYSHACKHAVM